MFGWLETTALANWVALSLWAYPALLSVHIIGLAMVVGIFMMRDLRLMGLVQGIDPQLFIKLAPLAWTGFALNLGSGLMLFTSQASVFAVNTPFLVKITCISVNMIIAWNIQSRLKRQLVTGAGEIEDNSLRVISCLSIAIWIAAISAGRLIAYF